MWLTFACLSLSTLVPLHRNSDPNLHFFLQLVGITDQLLAGVCKSVVIFRFLPELRQADTPEEPITPTSYSAR